MKKLISLLIVCATVLGLYAPLSRAPALFGAPLSERGDEEILAFLSYYGIDEVGLFEQWTDEQNARYARDALSMVEELGYVFTNKGWTVYWDMDQAIEAAAKDYYARLRAPANLL